jgi:peroxiredoxin
MDRSPAPRSFLHRPLIRAALALALLLPLLAAFAILRARDDNAASVDRPETTATAPDGVELGALDSRSPVRGEPAPDFRLLNAEGEPVRLADLRGKVVWVNFWATWCRPCRRELPDIQKIYDEMRDDGLEVLAVNVEDNADDARAFFDDVGVDLPMLLDTHSEVYDQYRLRGLPDSFFIDREGNVAAVYYGFLTEEIARDRLADAGMP